jgi:hypothetical protein
VRVHGDDAPDALLIAAFERIEAARGEIPLTYFEFGTLAALAIFADADLIWQSSKSDSAVASMRSTSSMPMSPC